MGSTPPSWQIQGRYILVPTVGTRDVVVAVRTSDSAHQDIHVHAQHWNTVRVIRERTEQLLNIGVCY